MLTEMIEILKSKGWGNQDNRLLVACSGGIDSVVLLHLLTEAQRELAFDLAVIHVDHMLRDEQSYGDLKFVEELAKKYGVPFYSQRINIPKIVENDGGNIQEVCRNERYRYFQLIMKEYHYTHLVTGHHLDDFTETVWMQLARAQIPVGIVEERKIQQGFLIRPLLKYKKMELEKYAEYARLEHREDPSNESTDYIRNAVRHKVLPQVQQIDPHFAIQTYTVAEQLRTDQAYLNELAKQGLNRIVLKKKNDELIVDCRLFKNEAFALQTRIITLLLNYLYNTNQQHISYSTALIQSIQQQLLQEEGTKELHLPEQRHMLREYHKAYFYRKKSHQVTHRSPEVIIGVNEQCSFNDFKFRLVEVEKLEEYASDAYVYYLNQPQLLIRTKEPGDRMQWKGLKQPKKIARLFIDEKIGVEQREMWPLILDAQTKEVIIVPKLRFAEKINQTTDGQYRYALVVEPI